jgi:RNA polymerase sigma-70 factor (ECF subfamily)
MKQDERAFRDQLLALLPRLRRFASALAARNEDAEDLLQSAIERALNRWRSFEQGKRLDSWMFKVMQNLWFDMRRSGRAEGWVSDDGLEIVGEDGRQVLEARDEMRAVREAFARLPQEHREVLALVVLEGFSYADAADALGVPIGTVMSRLSRARAALGAETRPIASVNRVKGEG